MAAYTAFRNSVSKVTDSVGLGRLTNRLANRASRVKSVQDKYLGDADGLSWRRSNSKVYESSRVTVPFIGMAVTTPLTLTWILTVMSSREATQKMAKKK